MRTLAALVIVTVSVAGCRPGPDAPIESVVGDRVTVVFNVGDTPQSYVGYGTQSMRIDDRDLTRIGLASSADPALFPDRSVFALTGVEPRDAIILFDYSGEEAEPVLFTHDGISPPLVPGVCEYYAAPEEIGCPPPGGS